MQDQYKENKPRPQASSTKSVVTPQPANIRFWAKGGSKSKWGRWTTAKLIFFPERNSIQIVSDQDNGSNPILHKEFKVEDITEIGDNLPYYVVIKLADSGEIRINFRIGFGLSGASEVATDLASGFMGVIGAGVRMQNVNAQRERYINNPIVFSWIKLLSSKGASTTNQYAKMVERSLVIGLLAFIPAIIIIFIWVFISTYL
jgi:hypothetical protein